MATKMLLVRIAIGARRKLLQLKVKKTSVFKMLLIPITALVAITAMNCNNIETTKHADNNNKGGGMPEASKMDAVKALRRDFAGADLGRKITYVPEGFIGDIDSPIYVKNHKISGVSFSGEMTGLVGQTAKLREGAPDTMVISILNGEIVHIICLYTTMSRQTCDGLIELILEDYGEFVTMNEKNHYDYESDSVADLNIVLEDRLTKWIIVQVGRNLMISLIDKSRSDRSN